MRVAAREPQRSQRLYPRLRRHAAGSSTAMPSPGPFVLGDHFHPARGQELADHFGRACEVFGLAAPSAAISRSFDTA